ncbi:hypothetical protein EJP77_09470 [Paenibacillus zeisoli]|uniref:ABC transporter permease n=1 Tax=Paenibacillus zeisoli TaxID=2496267 RepID=A0A433XC58_9BACL|nr:hypothetical protein [Paenibacillus zeisoli]RUT31614.1 hypothetical protein EJP77_09470 [Paenibacillus zeisoli]
MNTWREGWFIFWNNLRSAPLYLLWNVVFMLYMGLTTSFLFTRGDRDPIDPLPDFMLLLLVPLTGFLFCRRGFRYLKDDSYTKMLYYYRILPIPLKFIMSSRIIHLLFALVLNNVIFFGFMLVMSYSYWVEMSAVSYISFVITWVGYGLLMTGSYIYYEFLKRGVIYMWASIIVNFLVACLAFVIYMNGGNLVRFVMEYSMQYGLLSPLMWGALVVGGLVLALICRITLRKMAFRDLA